MRKMNSISAIPHLEAYKSSFNEKAPVQEALLVIIARMNFLPAR